VEVIRVQPVSEEKVENDRPGTKMLDAVMEEAVKTVTNWVDPTRVEKFMVDTVSVDTLAVDPNKVEK